MFTMLGKLRTETLLSRCTHSVCHRQTPPKRELLRCSVKLISCSVRCYAWQRFLLLLLVGSGGIYYNIELHFYCKARVNALLSFITEKTSEVSFCAIYEKAVDMTYDPAQNPRKGHRGPDPKERYKGVYIAVMNKLIDQITTRFANIENQGFSSTAQFSFISRNVSWIPFQLRHLTACWRDMASCLNQTD